MRAEAAAERARAGGPALPPAVLSQLRTLLLTDGNFEVRARVRDGNFEVRARVRDCVCCFEARTALRLAQIYVRPTARPTDRPPGRPAGQPGAHPAIWP